MSVSNYFVLVKLPTEFTFKSKSSNCECGDGPQPLVLKKIFYENHNLKAVLHINMSKFLCILSLC